MTTYPPPSPSAAASVAQVPEPIGLRAAVAAHLARYKGISRVHTDADLRVYLIWCTDQGLDPLAARRSEVELYVRWLQEARQLQPSTVSRRLSVVIGFYRTCVIDAILDHSPADYVRRPTVPPESPTLGLSHLQFEPYSPPPADQPTHTTSRWSRCPACSACASSKPPPPTSVTSARNTARIRRGAVRGDAQAGPASRSVRGTRTGVEVSGAASAESGWGSGDQVHRLLSGGLIWSGGDGATH
jgi:hypothetical protein